MAVHEPSVQPPPGEAEPDLLTGEELAAMGDIGPCELIEGRLVHMSPTRPQHGGIESRLDRRLGAFVEERDLGEVQVGEVGIFTHRNPDTVRGADVLFISHERLARATPGQFYDVAPELVIEILSPDERWSYLKKKLREYFEIGVTVVLVVDPDERSVAAYRSLTDIREFGENDVLTIEDVLPGFSLPLADLFGSQR